jgi:hypothetical protein
MQRDHVGTGPTIISNVVARAHRGVRVRRRVRTHVRALVRKVSPSTTVFYMDSNTYMRGTV